jgi:hypothetical protein
MLQRAGRIGISGRPKKPATASPEVRRVKRPHMIGRPVKPTTWPGVRANTYRLILRRDEPSMRWPRKSYSGRSATTRCCTWSAGPTSAPSGTRWPAWRTRGSCSRRRGTGWSGRAASAACNQASPRDPVSMHKSQRPTMPALWVRCRGQHLSRFTGRSESADWLLRTWKKETDEPGDHPVTAAESAARIDTCRGLTPERLTLFFHSPPSESCPECGYYISEPVRHHGRVVPAPSDEPVNPCLDTATDSAPGLVSVRHFSRNASRPAVTVGRRVGRRCGSESGPMSTHRPVSAAAGPRLPRRSRPARQRAGDTYLFG